MKNWMLFTILFAGSLFTEANACWFYPYGEDVRYSFLNPHLFVNEQWRIFHYSSNSFEPDNPASWEGHDDNVGLWVEYCKGKVPADEVHQAVYRLGYFKVGTDSTNLMLRYLRKANDQDALEYLRFAKMCESLNQFSDDPWERNWQQDSATRSELIARAMKHSSSLVHNPQIARRYAFLAIRLAYYNHDTKTVRSLYQKHFAKSKKRDILDHWSLYFFTLTEPNSTRSSYYAAQVFMNAPDKRFAVLSSFNRKIPIESILALASGNREKSNVYAIRAIMRHDRALSDIKAIYRLAPDHDALETLLLREVNKLEDWIYTPYYTYWVPSVIANTSWWSKAEEKAGGRIYPLLQRRIISDRAYASTMLAFMNSIDPKKTANPQLLETLKVQLLFMTQRYTECIKLIERLQAELKPDHPLLLQIQKIKVLCRIADQQQGHATIPVEVVPQLRAYVNDARFMFAVARELEYLGNHTMAIAVLTKIDFTLNEIWYPDQDNQVQGPPVFWRNGGKGLQVNSFDDYFDHYSDYLDFVYTPQQLEDIVLQIDETHQTDFLKWLYSGLEKEKDRLLDILGTKYIRKDNLEAAHRTFGMISNEYWATHYSPWERSDIYYLFDENPFYQLKYTTEFIDHDDHEVLNKEVVTRKLLHFKQKATDPNEPDRAYYWFIVANCYYNMSYYGNSWMMRRFFRSSDDSGTGHEDDAEYYQCNLAREYYARAMEHGQTDEFRALCLAMMAKCERFRLGYEYPYDQTNWKWHERSKKLHQMNRYYRELEQKYPDYAAELSSGCEIFRELFEKRRAK